MTSVPAIENHGLLGILGAWPDLPFREFCPERSERLAAHFEAGLAQHRVFQASHVSLPSSAAAAWRPLEWDSALFGLPMGRLDLLWAPDEDPILLRELLNAVVEDCRSQGVRHLACRMKLERITSIQILEEAGFKYVDSLHTLLRQGVGNAGTWAGTWDGRAAVNKGEEASPVRAPRPEDRDAVLEIARHAFAQNRFVSDPHLPSEKAEELYARWAENCLLGRRGDYVGILELDGQVAGFITCLIQEPAAPQGPRIGTIDLVAVAPGFLGRGGGRHLVQAALHGMASRTDLQTVGTRCDNYPALSLYMKAGFRLSSSHLGMHLWLS